MLTFFISCTILDPKLASKEKFAYVFTQSVEGISHFNLCYKEEKQCNADNPYKSNKFISLNFIQFKNTPINLIKLLIQL